MPPPNTETFIPGLLAKYVHSRRVELGIPLETVLPFVTGPTAVEQVFPRVMFMTTDTKFPHPKRMDLTITAELQTGTERQDIPDENLWTTAVRFALADRFSFMAWLADQAESERTGYAVRKMRLEDAGAAVDDKEKIRGRRTVVILHVRSDELAPQQPA